MRPVCRHRDDASTLASSNHIYPFAMNILSRIPGEYVAAALNALPDSATTPEETLEWIFALPGFGTVRFSGRKLRSKKGKSVRLFWSAYAAVQIE
ncbi:MAG TPA: hypothetical protein VFB04_08340 [Terriglobales bacterium]|nr:hypothetical protein [Terriglobales bacterium]